MIRIHKLSWVVGMMAAFLSVQAMDAGVTAGVDENITQPVPELEHLLAADPLKIVKADISRPKAKGDITLRAEVSFGTAPPLRVKVRKAEPGAESFNNVPRYDFAAYEIQKLFLDPGEYVIPPTVLRMMPLADIAAFAPAAVRTFPDAEQVLVVIQYWLNDVTVPADVYDASRFAADPVYARHIGQLNLLTYLISHADSNLGNFMMGKRSSGPRVFSVDNGVAFTSTGSDRGQLWHDLRVSQLPGDALDRLMKVSLKDLETRLGVLAQWKLEDGRYVPVAVGTNLNRFRGVRRAGGMLQMGLTQKEIQQVFDLLQSLKKKLDRGSIMRLTAAG